MNIARMENLELLTPSERFIFDWQYRLAGDFKKALAEAIARADDGNLARLRLGFPDEVEGYLRFSRESGWWQGVENKMGLL